MNAPTPQAGAMLPAVQSPNEVIRMGMDTVQGFEALQRAANLLSASSIVPESYRRFTVNKEGDRIENPNGLANCVVALNMASRMGADPILIMQNLHVIEGRPSWSSIFIIASINQCGRFSPLRFDLSEPGDEIDVDYAYQEWHTDERTGKRRPTDKVGKVKIRPRTCRAWAVEKATGTRIDGPEVSMQLAVDEGWIQRKGSKWRTMPEVMLRYRAASLFGKLYAPELLMGLQSREELEDVFDVIDAETGEVHTVRAKAPRDVTPRASAAPVGIPTGLGSWTVEQLDELEEMIEKIHAAISAAGFKEEADQFEATTRAKRSKSNPDALLSELRANLADLTAPKAAAPADPSHAAEPKARGGAKKEAPAGDGSLFQGEKA